MGARPNCPQRSRVSVRQISPRAWVAMKLMASGVTCSAASIRSPSFSRSSSSTRMTIRPARRSATISSTGAMRAGRVDDKREGAADGVINGYRVVCARHWNRRAGNARWPLSGIRCIPFCWSQISPDGVRLIQPIEFCSCLSRLSRLTCHLFPFILPGALAASCACTARRAPMRLPARMWP